MFVCVSVFLCNFVLSVFAMGRVAWNKPVMMKTRLSKNALPFSSYQYFCQCTHDRNVVWCNLPLLATAQKGNQTTAKAAATAAAKVALWCGPGIMRRQATRLWRAAVLAPSAYAR